MPPPRARSASRRSPSLPPSPFLLPRLHPATHSHCLRFLSCCLALLLLLPSLPPPLPPTTAPSSLPILSSPGDPRLHRLHRLPNGLTIALVHDPSSPAAGAAVSVRAGSLSDPDSYPGLAHFLEHMLFMGSAAYPSENEYSAFLSAHGGASNAFTSQDETLYFFSVDAPSLAPALHRFAGFFTGPLLRRSALSREVQAVDAEHAKNLQSDGWRAWQLLKHLASPLAPLHAFSTGNAATLAVRGVRGALLAFWGRHYVAPRLCGALVGPQPLHELEALAGEAFGGVRTTPLTLSALEEEDEARGGGGGAAGGEEGGGANAAELAAADDAAFSALLFASVEAAARAAAGVLGSPTSTFPPPPFNASARGTVTLFSPIGLSHELTLLWPLPPSGGAHGERVGAARYIASVLQDEGVGSIRSHLRAAGLADSVSAGVQVETRGGLQLFAVSFFTIGECYWQGFG